MSNTLNDDLLAELGKRVKALRIEKGISQSCLALKCHMEKATVSKIENGKVNISFLIIHRLSKCLNVFMGEICGDLEL